MKIKVNFENVYIFMVCLVSFNFVILTYSNIEGGFREVLQSYYSVIWTAFRLFVIIKLFLKFNRKTVVPVLLLCFFIYDFTVCGNSELYMAIWFIVGACYVKLDKLFNSLFKTLLSSTLFIVFMGTLGYLEDIQMIKRNHLRHSLGFSHPNTLALFCIELTLLYLYNKKKKCDIIKISLITMIHSLIYLIARSDTQLIIAIIIVVLLLCDRFFGTHRKNVIYGYLDKYRWGGYSILALCVVYVFFNFDKMVDLLTKSTSGNLYVRLRQIYNYLRYYGISALGKEIITNYHTDVNGLYTLDNAYMYLLLGFGVVSFVLFIFAYIKVLQRLIKNKNYSGVLAVCMVLICGMTETMLLKITMNFTLYFISELFWLKPTLKKEKIKNERVIVGDNSGI